MAVSTASSVTAASLARRRRFPNPQPGSGSGTLSSRSTTLVGSSRTGPQGSQLSERSQRPQRPASSTSTPTYYSISRFQHQNMHDDGTLHGRAATRTAEPHPDIYILFYQVWAARAILDFDARFGRV
ncbi:hypothetical protein C8A05DRAFT_36640 [Staphylotrichum tortipilum]|uniref:Uncharacterized protein n=1 Tax=Staphylotrichum tortipilum TaxID=2831512 RepID=A0AAN6MFB1_9PEZI|nr:hypothetical protein C8A05DRAFT_36640 [Staphylotrichum longicolle]